MLRKLLGTLLILLGLASAGLGVASATVWRDPDAVVATAAPQGDGTLVVTEPGVLELVGSDVTVRATAPEGVTVTLAVGRDVDVDAWVGVDHHTRVTGLTDWETLTARAVVPDVPEAAEGAEAPVPGTGADPAGNDMWVAEETGEGTVTLRWDDRPGRWSLVAAGVGEGATAPTLELTWPREVATAWLWPGVVAGAVLLLAGLAVLVAGLLMRPRKRPRAARAADSDARVAGLGRQRRGGAADPEGAAVADDAAATEGGAERDAAADATDWRVAGSRWAPTSSFSGTTTAPGASETDRDGAGAGADGGRSDAGWPGTARSDGGRSDAGWLGTVRSDAARSGAGQSDAGSQDGGSQDGTAQEPAASDAASARPPLRSRRAQRAAALASEAAGGDGGGARGTTQGDGVRGTTQGDGGTSASAAVSEPGASAPGASAPGVPDATAAAPAASAPGASAPGVPDPTGPAPAAPARARRTRRSPFSPVFGSRAAASPEPASASPSATASEPAGDAATSAAGTTTGAATGPATGAATRPTTGTATGPVTGAATGTARGDAVGAPDQDRPEPPTSTGSVPLLTRRELRAQEEARRAAEHPGLAGRLRALTGSIPAVRPATGATPVVPPPADGQPPSRRSRSAAWRQTWGFDADAHGSGHAVGDGDTAREGATPADGATARDGGAPGNGGAPGTGTGETNGNHGHEEGNR